MTQKAEKWPKTENCSRKLVCHFTKNVSDFFLELDMYKIEKNIDFGRIQTISLT
jgi:hypothetical protein